MEKSKKNLIVNIVLLVVLLILIIVLLLGKYVVSPMRISGTSMMPTLTDGQMVLMRHTRDVKKGDIVIYRHDDKLVIKRLIATAGDRVRIDREGYVYVNDERLVEDYILDGATIANPNTMDIVVGDGMYFFLGDNRNNSRDSEDYGTVSGDAILGKKI